MDSETVGYVLSGKKRLAVLLALDRPRTPTEISKIARVGESNVWKKLDDLQKKGLIVCTTPLRRKGRLYDKTPAGAEVFDSIKDRVDPLMRKR